MRQRGIPRDRNWKVGEIVTIGFMLLTVARVETLDEREDRFLPRKVFLEGEKGETYTFTPYCGLERT